MNWVSIIFLFGILAALLFLVSLVCFTRAWYRLGILFAVLELLAAAPPTLVWMHALEVSGKMDWLLLGLLSYTPVALCFYAMLIVGVVCLILNLRGIRGGKTPVAPAPGSEADGEKTSGME